MDPNTTIAQAVQHVWETTTLGDVQRAVNLVAVAVGFWVAVFVAAATAVAAVPRLHRWYWQRRASRTRRMASDRRFETVYRAMFFGDEDAKAALLGRRDKSKEG